MESGFVMSKFVAVEIPCSGSQKRNRDEEDHDTTQLQVRYSLKLSLLYHCHRHQIVKRRRLELQSGLTCGSGYRLHAACQSGRAVVVKVFEGPRAQQANFTAFETFQFLITMNPLAFCSQYHCMQTSSVCGI